MNTFSKFKFNNQSTDILFIPYANELKTNDIIFSP